MADLPIWDGLSITERFSMSQSHLRQLREALVRRGWKIFERLRGDEGFIGAATWELQRSDVESPLMIDFDALGGMGEDIPLELSYGCQVRGRTNQLYFRRVKRSREL